MKVPAIPAALAATLLLCSCVNSETPTSPSMSGSGAPGPSFLSGPSASAVWKGMRTVVASTGPDDCLVHDPFLSTVTAGTIPFGVLANRNGSGLEIMWGDPTFTYEGTIAGSAFTAVASNSRGWNACVGFSYSSTISGTFSADGRQLTADSIETYVLDSGQTNTFTFRWVLAE